LPKRITETNFFPKENLQTTQDGEQIRTSEYPDYGALWCRYKLPPSPPITFAYFPTPGQKNFPDPFLKKKKGKSSIVTRFINGEFHSEYNQTVLDHYEKEFIFCEKGYSLSTFFP
jgi:hypothetical protein